MKTLLVVLGILLVFIFVFIIIREFFKRFLLNGIAQSMLTLATRRKPGNSDEYALENVKSKPDSPLKGKTLIFLGSSVTRGAASQCCSFADYIAKRNSCTIIKEAVNGTTLVDTNNISYIARMKKNLDPNLKIDAFLCQLSTNDATMKSKLGKISNSFDMNDFDINSSAGAIEYIIAYAKKTWNCPVIFYTGTRFDNADYEILVNCLLEIQKKWNIGVIDLWNDPEMNSVSNEDYKLYMNDGIHPTKAGYQEWWTPKFESYLYYYLK